MVLILQLLTIFGLLEQEVHCLTDVHTETCLKFDTPIRFLSSLRLLC